MIKSGVKLEIGDTAQTDKVRELQRENVDREGGECEGRHFEEVRALCVDLVDN